MQMLASKMASGNDIYKSATERSDRDKSFGGDVLVSRHEKTMFMADDESGSDDGGRTSESRRSSGRAGWVYI
jgi:hypothetical protein